MSQPAGNAVSPSTVAEAQRLYREFYARCFWSSRPDLTITPELVAWVQKGLRRHGGMAGWRAAARLKVRS